MGIRTLVSYARFFYGGLSYALVCFAVTFYFVRKVALNWFDGSWKFILSAFVILAFCNIKADTFAFRHYVCHVDVLIAFWHSR